MADRLPIAQFPTDVLKPKRRKKPKPKPPPRSIVFKTTKPRPKPDNRPTGLGVVATTPTYKGKQTRVTVSPKTGRAETKTVDVVAHDPTRAKYWIEQRGYDYKTAVARAQAERKKRGLPGLGHVLYGESAKKSNDNLEYFNKIKPSGYKLTPQDKARISSAKNHDEVRSIAANISWESSRAKATKVAGVTVPRPDLFAKDVTLNLAAAPGALYEAGKHPIRTIENLPRNTLESLKYSFSEKGYREHPSGVALWLLGGGAVGKSLVTRSVAGAKAAKAGAGFRGSLKAARRANIKHATLKMGEGEVQVPLTKNPLLQPLAEARAFRQGQKLAKGADVGSHRAIVKEVAAASRYGRALRDFHRTQQRLRVLPADQAADSLKWVMKKGPAGKLHIDAARDLAVQAKGLAGEAVEPRVAIQKIVDRHTSVLKDLEADLASDTKIVGIAKSKISGYEESAALQEARANVVRLQAEYDRVFKSVEPKPISVKLRTAKAIERDIEKLKKDPASFDLRRSHTYTNQAARRLERLRDELAAANRAREVPSTRHAMRSPTVQRAGAALGVAKEHLAKIERREGQRAARIAEKAPAPDRIIERVLTPAQRQVIEENILRQREIIASAPQALKIMEENSTKFQDAVKHTRALSRATEGELIAAGDLTPEVAAGRIVAIAREYGFDPPEDGFFFSMRYMENPVTGANPANIGRTAGLYGLNAPQKLAGLGKHYTGAETRLPYVVHTVLDRFNRTMKLSGTRALFEDLYKSGHDIKQSVHDIPIRNGKISPEFRAAMRKASLEIDDGGEVSAGTLQEIKNALLPKADTVDPLKPIEGVRWIDPRIVKDITQTRGGYNPLMTTIDTINDVSRAGTLYLRPAYALNALGNAGMNLVTQGFLMPVRLYQAAFAKRLYGQHVYDVLRAGMGEGKALSYMTGKKGPVHGVTRKLGGMWNKVTDERFRVAAAIHNADLEGFSGKKGLQELARVDKNGQFAHPQDLARVFQRANDDIVDFSSLTPFEMGNLSRIVYFYPWMSRGSQWAVRTTYEHPVKSLAASEAGYQERPKIEKALGGLIPNWVKEAGIVPVSGGEQPKVFNPASVWTPTTLSQVLNPAMRGHLEDLPTPAVAAVAELLTGGGPEGATGQLLGLPQISALGRFGIQVPGARSPKGTYPERGVWPALGPIGAGGLYPRKIEPSKLRDQAIKEASSPRAAKLRWEGHRQELIDMAKKQGFQGVLSPELEKAIRLRAEEASVVAGQKGYVNKLKAVTKLAVKIGAIPRSELKGILDRVDKYDENTARNVLRSLEYNVFGEKLYRQARDELRSQGP